MVEDMLLWGLLAGGTIGIAAAQVFHSLGSGTKLLVVLGAALICTVRWASTRRKLANYDLGLLGERSVGDALANGLRGTDGYAVFHDVPFDRMNIDHILVGPGGVFTVETKMARKRTAAPSRIMNAHGQVTINGRPGWGGKAVWAARREAAWLRAHLLACGITASVQGVVVYPGWYVTDDCTGGVWVLNESYFIEKVRRLPRVLSEPQVRRIRNALAQYDRASAAREQSGLGQRRYWAARA